MEKALREIELMGDIDAAIDAHRLVASTQIGCFKETLERILRAWDGSKAHALFAELGRALL